MTEKEKKVKEAEDFSPAVQEILGRTPSWMVRWGISLFMVLLLLAIAGSWFFRYPDMVRSEVTITTETPPVALVARASGLLQHIAVKDTQLIRRSQIAAVIENPSSFPDVERLKEALRKTGEEGILSGQVSAADTLPGELKLGDIQAPYALFARAADQYRDFHELDYHGKKISSVNEEIKKYSVYYTRLNLQKKLIESQLLLVKKQLERDSLLFDRGVIPAAEFEKTQAGYLTKQHEYEQSRVNLSQAAIRISELEQQAIDLGLQQRQELNRHTDQILESYRRLMATIDEWEQRYVLRSPMNGRVSFTKYWSEGQYVEQGQSVMRIVPEDPGQVIGRLSLHSRRSGKVKAGQDVLIRLENFPYLEFGVLRGKVKSISLLPEREGYMVEVCFSSGLKTNYGKELDYRQEMTGLAEIMTDRRPLLLRIVEPFRYILEKNRSIND